MESRWDGARNHRFPDPAWLDGAGAPPDCLRGPAVGAQACAACGSAFGSARLPGPRVPQPPPLCSANDGDLSCRRASGRAASSAARLPAPGPAAHSCRPSGPSLLALPPEVSVGSARPSQAPLLSPRRGGCGFYQTGGCHRWLWLHCSISDVQLGVRVL